MEIRKSEERGYFDHGWLRTFHTFSFADYYDPRFMGYRSLRVLNEDRVAPGMGFGRHAHRDMEIVTWVLDGTLRHGDSMGNGSIIRPGEVQRMSAGTGVTHSEENGSASEEVHFIQIWILPERTGLSAGYEQKATGIGSRPNELIEIAGESSDRSVRIHQNARILAARLDGGEVSHAFDAGRGGWMHVARGSVEIGGTTLGEGDGAWFEPGELLDAKSDGEAEILVFDLA